MFVINKDVAGFFGFVVFLFALILATQFSSTVWFSFFVTGGTLFFGYLNHKLKNISVLNYTSRKFFISWAVYILAAVVFELIGRFLLRLWSYPSFNFLDEIFNILVNYPFVFFMIYETFNLIKKWIKQTGLALILTTIFNSFMSEIPNTFSHEWRYTIPFVSFEILYVNIVVLFSWIFLVLTAFLVQDKINL